jgi:hypothetical protein
MFLLRAPIAASTVHDAEAATAKPNWLTMACWVFVSEVPSGLLIAVTAHISTGVFS